MPSPIRPSGTVTATRPAQRHPTHDFAPRHKPLRQPVSVKQFQGTGVHDQRPAQGRGAGQRVHHPGPHAVATQLQRQQQARGSGTDNQHIGGRRQHDIAEKDELAR